MKHKGAVAYVATAATAAATTTKTTATSGSSSNKGWACFPHLAHQFPAKTNSEIIFKGSGNNKDFFEMVRHFLQLNFC